MKLSRRADYALRAVRNLSKLPEGNLNSINAIAREASIPREFLAKILQDLTAAGILASFKGVTGGYRLRRPANRISFLDVIEAINGPLHLSLCTESGRCSCRRDDRCHMHQFWVAQEKVIRNALRRQHFGITP
jgi:Rrf2 family protein